MPPVRWVDQARLEPVPGEDLQKSRGKNFFASRDRTRILDFPARYFGLWRPKISIDARNPRTSPAHFPN
jgi:hypothetical protein